MELYYLRTNPLKSPVIDSAPEFSWKIKSDNRNVVQTAYRITVSDDKGVVWDSGLTESDKQTFIQYEGSLKSKTVYHWTVTVWDNQGNEAVSGDVFETAFLDKSEWKAVWVESTVPRNEAKLFTYGIENPVVLFERGFMLSDKVKKARLYATAYGCYRSLINGKRIDGREFAPEFTPYGKILNYQTYDIAGLLTAGDNQIEFYVGDGWLFCPQTEVETPEKHNAPAILYQIEIEYENGEKDIVSSDGTETVRATNILFSDLFMGEKTDRTLPFGKKQPVEIRNYDLSVLRAQPMPPVIPVELIPAKDVFISPKREIIVDFGQVIAGRARIEIDAPEGAEITFEYTEVLDKEHNYFATMSLRQCDTVISDGNPFLHEAMFTFHGFRYIRVTGLKNVKKEDFTAVLLSTEKENAGEFTCDDERFNRLYKNIRYSQRNNMLSIPTDCPTREKAGWTGDILIYAETALLNEEMTPFLSSWLSGAAADQRNSGAIPLVSPLTKLYNMVAMQRMSEFGDTEITGIAGWSDAIIWVPYTMYSVTGNKKILRDCFPAMQRWCEYIIKTANEKRGSDLPEEIDKYLWNTGFHFGEWLVPGRPQEGFEVCKESACYVAPFFGYYSIKLMSDICRILGKDGTHYKELCGKMKQAIIKGIIEKSALPDYLMGAYVLAFAFDLVPEEYAADYKNRLVNLIEKNGRTFGTGFLATPFLLAVLNKLGKSDLAKDILFNEKQPSWLYEIRHGATAIWESWMAMDKEGNPSKVSFDHYAFGCVDSYIFHTICGISGDAGYRNIIIAPLKDSGFDSFRRSFICEAGEIIVDCKGEKLSVTIPCNTKATVIWNGKTAEIGSGSYNFE